MKTPIWGCIGLLVAAPIGTVLRGWGLMQLWQWFLVPLGVVSISLPWALGISVLSYLLTEHADTNHVNDSRPANELLLRSVMRLTVIPLLAWGLGALWHSLM